MKILIVDDDLEFVDHLRFLLEESFDVDSSDNPADAFDKILNNEYGAVLLDIDLKSDITGLNLLEKIRNEGNDLPIIMVSGTTSIETVVTAMKSGADDYIGKTVKVEELKASIFRALTSAKQKRELLYLRTEIDQIKGRLWGESEGIKNIREMISTVSSTDSPILIIGESGTGKELVARSIHQASPRNKAPFITINCAAIPKELFESEFFGHEKGSFTGAIKRQIGKLELADQGIIFLDEIGELTLEMQAKFLRVLQEKKFRRIGSSQEVESDFHLISATNRDLSESIVNGTFRDDLYYRIKVVQIDVPPLRDRKADIPLLTELLTTKKCTQMNRKALKYSPEALNLLLSYNWPGNVRELENVIECTLIFCKKEMIGPSDVRGISVLGQSQLPDYETGKRDVTEKYQKEYIELALDIFNGNVSKTAESMGLSRQGLYNLLRKLNIDHKDHGI